MLESILSYMLSVSSVRLGMSIFSGLSKLCVQSKVQGQSNLWVDLDGMHAFGHRPTVERSCAIVRRGFVVVWLALKHHGVECRSRPELSRVYRLDASKSTQLLYFEGSVDLSETSVQVPSSPKAHLTYKIDSAKCSPGQLESSSEFVLRILKCSSSSHADVDSLFEATFDVVCAVFVCPLQDPYVVP